MSVPYSPSHDGSLCGVRGCSGLAEATCDVPVFGPNSDTREVATVELALCVIHLAELHEASDPIQLAREWVA